MLPPVPPEWMWAFPSALEVGEDRKIVVVGKVGAHIVLRQVGATLHGQGHGAVLVHNVYISDGGVAVVLHNLVVHGRVGPLATISHVVLHDGGAVEGLDQRTDQISTQVVAPRFSGRQLDCDIAGGGCLQRLIGRHEAVGADVRGHEYRGDTGGIIRCAL